MRLLTFEAHNHRRLGAEDNGTVVDLAAAHAASGAAGAFPKTMLEFIEAGPAARAAARTAVTWSRTTSDSAVRRPLADTKLCAPIHNPGKILCSGVNYMGHLTENPSAVLPETPGCFAKLASAIIGPGEPIVHPPQTTQLDYEVEFAVILGQRLRHASEAEAQAAVFGYTILHDVSARDVQFKQPMHNQITLGKNFDSFCPLGPWIVTVDALPDIGNLGLRTYVNGALLQNGTTAEWVFSLPMMLSFFSAIMTLEPGDIITTGTPAGVGVFRQPPVYLHPGDLVRLEIDGIGALENPVV